MNKGKKIASAVLIVILLALVCAYFALGLDKTADMDLKDRLIWETVPRLVAGGALIALLCLAGYGKVFSNVRLRGGVGSVLFLIPCLLVILANFPFTALADGSAAIDYPGYIWLFALKCLSIGILEETVFRGFIQLLFAEHFKKSRYAAFLTVLCTSAIFGLWHIVNLFAGASVGATLMQVGYSFLTGAMFSAILLKTDNLWLCVLAHAAFDFGGLIVGDLGHGAFQDTWFWIFTAVAAVICTVEVLLYLLPKKNTEDGDD